MPSLIQPVIQLENMRHGEQTRGREELRAQLSVHMGAQLWRRPPRPTASASRKHEPPRARPETADPLTTTPRGVWGGGLVKGFAQRHYLNRWLAKFSGSSPVQGRSGATTSTASHAGALPAMAWIIAMLSLRPLERRVGAGRLGRRLEQPPAAFTAPGAAREVPCSTPVSS